jgi:hypothetical protein
MVKPKETESMFFVLPIIMLAMAFVVLLVTLYPYYHTKNTRVKQISFPTPTATPALVKWQTYKNDTYGFEFQYPSSFKFYETTDEISLCLPSSPCFSITFIKPITDNNTKSINFTFNGEKAAKYDFVSGGEGIEGTVIKVLLAKPIYIVTNKMDIENQILSTFKFYIYPSITPTLTPISTPTKTVSKYTCPTTEWVDCMPGPSKPKPQCQADFLKWASNNCPNFKGAAL